MSADPAEFPYLDGGESLDCLRDARASKSSRVFVLVLFVMFGVSVVALALTPWVQTSFAEGRVIANAPLERQQNIEAPIEGRVHHWYVHEGSHVAAGDLVVDLSDNDPEIIMRLGAERNSVLARIEAVRTRIALLGGRAQQLGGSRTAAVTAASQRVAMARNRVRSAEQAQAAAQAALDTARRQRARQSTLAEQGLASTRTAELAMLDYTRAETDLIRATAALYAARSEEGAFQSDQTRAGTDISASIGDALATQAATEAELANANAELARIDVRMARQSTMRVTAARAGTILRLLANQGTDMVRAGDALAVLIPDTNDRAVELWIDGNDIPLVQEGRHVRLQFEGWPAVQFSGWPSVSVGTFGGRVSLVDATDNGRGKFRVVVVPDGAQPWPSARFLRQGVRGNGWILLGRVSLGYELWRQFNGFPATYAMEEASKPAGSSTPTSSGPAPGALR